MYRARLVTVLASVTASCCLASAAEPDDYWRGWRARQRAELATLPKPRLPHGSAAQPIDRFLSAYWTLRQITPLAVVDHRTFARRVYLDVVGLLPTVKQLDGFVRDTDPAKRSKLVDSLLADRQGYAEHWITFWNDLLRNDEEIRLSGRRKPITRWLYTALLENKPLDLFVAELLNPGPDGPDGFLKGVKWTGQVSASQLAPIQAAQDVAQVFLASSIRCASCHDSFINEWKLEEAYGLASFFAPQNLEMHRCDRPTGKRVPPKFLFAGLGEVAANADMATRLRAVARMVTRPKNGRFARAIVNRLWQRLLGRGLCEPVDDFDTKQPKSELLDWLAHDFMAHDYDVKHALRLILLSRLYQAPVAQSKSLPAHFLGPVARRLTAEQYLDAVAQVTEYWAKTKAVMNVAVSNPQIRAWRHRTSNNLAIALGRPNREHVCTERNQESTVLQALELINGSVLATHLKEGARVLLASDLGRVQDTSQAASTLYLRALGRLPNDEEIAVARGLLGFPNEKPAARQEGWEDFLWILCMSPEFQFVR
jgi:hypothetical protein